MKPNTLILCAVLPLLVPAAIADAPISWKPSSLTTAAYIGTVTAATFHVTSATTVTNAEVRVVPALAPYLTVQPSTISLLPGQSQQIYIVTTIPKTTIPTTVEGAIQIRAGNTLAVPLSVSLTVEQPNSSIIPTTTSAPSPDRISTISQTSTIQFVSDEVEIFFQTATPPGTVQQVVSSVGGTFLGSVPALQMYQVLVPTQGYGNINAIISVLESFPSVTFAIPALLSQGNASGTPNDPCSQPANYALSALNLPAAWSMNTGSSSVKVAVIDSVFSTWSDLSPNVVHFSTHAAPVTTSHGTRVASIIGAKGNNGIGVAGVMWDVSLYLYETFIPGSTDAWNISWIADAAANAIANNVKVINISGGISCATQVCTPDELNALTQEDQFFKSLIAGAQQSGHDITWVFSAGNAALPVGRASPARLSNSVPNVISVGAINSQRRLALFPSSSTPGSDYGPDVTVYAPGLEVYSDTAQGACDNGTYSFPLSGDNGSADGTSFAAPFATGVVGLMLSVNRQIGASQIKEIIQSTASHTGNYDPLGSEIRVLDAQAAVEAAQPATGSWLSFAPGIPGVPGDGVTYSGFPTLTPSVSLANVTNGFTITGFPTGSLQNIINMYFGMIAPNADPSCHGISVGGPYSGTVVYNGVEGVYSVISQSLLDTLVSIANSQSSTCPLSLAEWNLSYISVGFTAIDAVSFGLGPNAFPIGVALTATGVILVSSNLPNYTFTITGPISFSSAPFLGAQKMIPDVPPGQYTITFGAVPGYTTPPPQTLAVSSGVVTQFGGFYQ